MSVCVDLVSVCDRVVIYLQYCSVVPGTVRLDQISRKRENADSSAARAPQQGGASTLSMQKIVAAFSAH